MSEYIPLTVADVAAALQLGRLNDAGDGVDNGFDIAAEMLNGKIKMTSRELQKIAAFKDLTVNELVDLDNRFAAYELPEGKVRKEIAHKMLEHGFDTEITSEMCGLVLDVVKKLRRRRH